MAFYWLLGAVAFGLPVAAALLSVRWPRAGWRVLAAWLALFAAASLVSVMTTLAAFSSLPMGGKIRAGLVVMTIVVIFGVLIAGLWRQQPWALVVLCTVLVGAAVINAVLSHRDGAPLEKGTIVSYFTLLPALLFMAIRAVRRPATPA